MYSTVFALLGFIKGEPNPRATVGFAFEFDTMPVCTFFERNRDI